MSDVMDELAFDDCRCGFRGPNVVITLKGKWFEFFFLVKLKLTEIGTDFMFDWWAKSSCRTSMLI